MNMAGGPRGAVQALPWLLAKPSGWVWEFAIHLWGGALGEEEAALAGNCHYPSGKGRPENAGVTGLRGARHGLWAPLMVQVVAKLGADDIPDLSAYLASLRPEP